MKVFNNVIKKDANQTLFLKFDAEQGETLSLEQTENLIMMPFSQFIENYNNFNNVCFAILSEEQKQYIWGNTTVSIEGSPEYISIIIKMTAAIGGIQLVFDVTIDFNAETEEFITASYSQSE